MLQHLITTVLIVTVLLQLYGVGEGGVSRDEFTAHSNLRNDSTEFTVSSSDDRMTTFIHTDSAVYHMEPNLHRPGNILYTDGYAIKTTDGVTSTTIAGHSTTSYYHEGVGTLARFSAITGFRQLSATEVVVVDHSNSCLRLINRVSLATSRFAGYCKNGGYAQGTSGARFSFPWSVITDNKKRGFLIVTDIVNDALRHVNSQLGSPRTVSTIIKSSTLDYPCSITQDPVTGDLYVTTHTYVFKVTYSSKSLSHITSGGNGFRDCDFSGTKFNNPREIILIDMGKKLLTADSRYNRLRVLNLNTSTASSLCSGAYGHTDGDMSTCTLSYPSSLMVLNDTLYVGESKRIRKVQDIMKTTCDDPYIREVASPVTGVAAVDVPLLEGSGKIKLQPGSYPFDVSGKSNCTAMIKVSDPRLRRRLVFTSVYDVDCETATGNITNSSLTHRVARSSFMRQLTDICQDDCNRADDSHMDISCNNNTLELTWPTDVTYSGSVVQIPADLESRLTTRIAAKGAGFYVVIPHRTPPSVYPQKTSDNSYIKAKLLDFCTDGGSYSAESDNCV